MSAPDIALSDSGIPCPQPVQVDGRLHRYKTEGDHDANSWYVFHQGQGFVCGAFGCWKRQFVQKWSDIEYGQLSADQKKAARLTWEEAAKKVKADQERAQQEARVSCGKLLAESPAATGGHPYLVNKGVKAVGDLRLAVADHVKDWLVIPLQDEQGVVWSCQFIAADGTKRFHYGGRVQGCYFEIQGKEGAPILICEGYATGATLAMATGWPVVCAMNCGNLLLVSQSIRRLNPKRTLVICADNDQFTEDNPGLEKARAAAKSIKAAVAFPTFSDEALAERPTDFNDLAALEGISSVRLQVNRVFKIIGRPIGDFQLPLEDDPNELLRHRFLSKRGGLLVPGPTGMGKSSWLIQAGAMWCLNREFTGIKPKRALSMVIIQAENDEGDIAEMRNGIATGMGLSEDERKTFFENVIVHTSTGLTGQRFCEEEVRQLLDLHSPDIIGIDPALSFLGGDVKEQKDVGNFLRQYLNPELYSHDCAAIILHHTNKPKSGKDENATSNGEWAYHGSGSAEWANWARAVLSVQSSGQPGVYKFHAGKRGARIGWRDEQDQPVYERVMLHSREKGVICWYDGAEEDMPDRGGRPSRYQPGEVVALLGDDGLSTSEWFRSAHDELGMSRSQFYDMKTDLAKADLAFFTSTSRKWVRVIKKSNNVQ